MDTRKLKDRAAQAFTSGKVDKAIELYEELVQAEPKDLQLKVRLGDSYRKAGRTWEAVKVYREVVDRYARDGLLLRAIAVCKIVLEVEPGHAETQALLADLYARKYGERTGLPAGNAIEIPGLDSSSPSVSGQVAGAEAMNVHELDLDTEPAPAPIPLTQAVPVAPLPPLELRDPIPLVAAADDSLAEHRALLAEEAAAAPVDELELPEGILVDEAEEAGDAARALIEQLAAGVDDEPGDEIELELSDAAPAPQDLPKIPLFSDLDRAAFVGLLEACKLRPMAAGEDVIRQGDPGDSLFVIVQGVCKVTRPDPAGGELLLASLGEGAFFGEIGFLSGSPRSATVTATEEGELLEITGDVLRRLLAEHPSVSQALHRFYRQRLLANLMATSQLFRPFDRHERKALIEKFRSREVARGEVILTEGHAVDGLYVVLAGSVAVVKSDGERRVVLATLREGELFGEIALLTRSKATATVVARRRGILLRLPREVFDELILTHPQILELVSTLSEERMQSTEAIVAGRLACDEEGLVLV